MITIGILRAKGLDDLSSLTNTRLLINNNLAIVEFSYSIAVNFQREEQNETPFTALINFEGLNNIRSQNKLIQMNLKSGQSLKFREFELPYREIHAEGFEDWFDFGNCIGLFIKIRISANEPNPKEAPNFDLHSILYIIQSGLTWKPFQVLHTNPDKLYIKLKAYINWVQKTKNLRRPFGFHRDMDT